MPFTIAQRPIGVEHPVYIIAEIGVNHDGSPERANELVRLANEAGADAVKFQLFEADRLMSSAAKLAAYQKAAGEADPIAMLRRLELTIDQMAPCVTLAHELGLHAIVSVFSVELVSEAERLPWDAYKTASPDIINKPLLNALAATGKPLIVSTGASTLDEVNRMLGWMKPMYDRLAVLQCVSAYPTEEGRSEIGGIRAIVDVFDGPVGYSDHTQGEGAGPHAVAWGACILEKHLTYDRNAKGPDHSASLTPVMFRNYVAASKRAQGTWEHRAELRDPAKIAAARNAIRAIPDEENAERAEAREFLWRSKLLAPAVVGELVKRVLPIEQDVRTVSRQSLTTTRDLPGGHTLTCADLTIKRPGTGIPPYELETTLNRTLARAVVADSPLSPDDLEQMRS